MNMESAHNHNLVSQRHLLMLSWAPSEGTDDSGVIKLIKSLPLNALEKLRRGEKNGFRTIKDPSGEFISEDWSDVFQVYTKLVNLITTEFQLLKKIRQADAWADYGYMAKYYIHTDIDKLAKKEIEVVN